RLRRPHPPQRRHRRRLPRRGRPIGGPRPRPRGHRRARQGHPPRLDALSWRGHARDAARPRPRPAREHTPGPPPRGPRRPPGALPPRRRLGRQARPHRRAEGGRRGGPPLRRVGRAEPVPPHLLSPAHPTRPRPRPPGLRPLRVLRCRLPVPLPPHPRSAVPFAMRLSGSYPFTTDPDPVEGFALRVLSLGAGVQSSRLLLGILEGEFGTPGEDAPSCAVFADTG